MSIARCCWHTHAPLLALAIQFWVSVSPGAGANSDYDMLISPAVSGHPSAISIHAASYPTHYLSVDESSPFGDLQFLDGVASGTAEQKAAASWEVVEPLAPGAGSKLYSLKSLSTGAYLSLALNSTAPCFKGDPNSFDVIADKSPANPKAATWAIGQKPPAPPAEVRKRELAHFCFSFHRRPILEFSRIFFCSICACASSHCDHAASQSAVCALTRLSVPTAAVVSHLTSPKDCIHTCLLAKVRHHHPSCGSLKRTSC